MDSYYITVDDKILKDNLSKKLDIDYKRELLYSRSKVNIRKFQTNSNKYPINKIEYNKTDKNRKRFNANKIYIPNNQIYIGNDNNINYMRISSIKNLKFSKKNLLENSDNNTY
jgi:hypothetical protein